MQQTAITDALTVDLEDYFQVEAFADRIRRDDWPHFASRVNRNSEIILDLLALYRTKATFFVLGWIAERQPELIRNIAAAGHEVACHSYSHQPVFRLPPHEFRQDLRRAKTAIEQATGRTVGGFRAPTFSIVQRSLWALEVLAEEGFVYDSSIFPVRHDLYGFPQAPRHIHRRDLPNGQTIIEVPMSTVRIWNQNFPAGGGGYLRLLPMLYTRWAIRRIHTKDCAPAIVYFHPWEIDPQQPRIHGSWRSRLRHYTNLSSTEARIKDLLASLRFEPVMSVLRRNGFCQ